MGRPEEDGGMMLAGGLALMCYGFLMGLVAGLMAGWAIFA
jgi:tetrahydromethanopterin S-methyltransferase subunit B